MNSGSGSSGVRAAAGDSPFRASLALVAAAGVRSGRGTRGRASPAWQHGDHHGASLSARAPGPWVPNAVLPTEARQVGPGPGRQVLGPLRPGRRAR
jgi:hypothetical protein